MLEKYCSPGHELFFSCIGLSFHIFQMYMYVSFLVLVCVVLHEHEVFVSHGKSDILKVPMT